MTTRTGEAVTLGDVAQAAGVSPATVSMVLNHRPQVAAATAERVWKLVEQLNYTRHEIRRGRPGAGARRSTRRTHTVTLFAAGTPRAVLQSPVYLDLIHGVETAVAENGMELVLRQVSDLDQVPQPILAAGLRGIVLFGRFEDSIVRRAVGQTPCVRVMGEVRRNSPWDHVTYANQAIGPMAADYLMARGHRQCAYLGMGEDRTFGERRHGFIDTIRRAGFQGTDFCGDLVERTEQRHAIRHEVLQQLLDDMLAMPNRPTGLFVAADMLTHSVFGLLSRRGVVPGRDIEIISCNNEHALLDDLHPRPAVIDIHAREIGRCAVERLLWRMENRNRPRVVISVDPELVAAQPSELPA